MTWGELNPREAVDICAKLQFDFDELTKLAGSEPEARSRWIRKQLNEVNEKIPEYKKIKYFVYTDKDFIRTTTLKVKRNDENKAIHDWMENLGKSIKELDGSYLD
jgi:long-chain acyl-CoA synthetase